MAEPVKLVFRLPQEDDGWPPYEVEGLWCRPRGSDYVVDNLPFFVHGLAFQDLISVQKDDHGDVVVFEVLEPAPYSIVWILFPDDDPDAPKLQDALRALGCEVEGFWPGRQWWLLSAAVPLEVPLVEVDAVLKFYLESGRAEVADGCIRHTGEAEAP